MKTAHQFITNHDRGAGLTKHSNIYHTRQTPIIDYKQMTDQDSNANRQIYITTTRLNMQQNSS